MWCFLNKCGKLRAWIHAYAVNVVRIEFTANMETENAFFSSGAPPLVVPHYSSVIYFYATVVKKNVKLIKCKAPSHSIHSHDRWFRRLCPSVGQKVCLGASTINGFRKRLNSKYAIHEKIQNPNSLERLKRAVGIGARSRPVIRSGAGAGGATSARL